MRRARLRREQDGPFFYRLLRSAFYVLFRLLTRLDVTGLENIPLSGPLIVAPNHIHILDSVLVYALIPRRVTVFAADKWRGTPAGWLLELVGNAIYVHRGEPDRSAVNKAISILRAGGTLGVAPEGTRSRTGGLQPGKNGATYLASRSGAAIVPLAAWGQEKVFYSWWRGRRPDIHVRIAEPIRLPAETERARTDDLNAYTDQLMLTLARLLPAQYRGIYAGRV
jgi:1-acyl-sn-glycerol-3-phosphate acyltransferase